MAGRPPLYDTPEALQTAIDLYFATNEVWTVTGLALSLGFESRQSFYDQEDREGFSYIVKRARLKVESAYELRLVTSTSPTGAIFALKNMGWKDKTEVDNNHTGAMPVILQETKTYLNK